MAKIHLRANKPIEGKEFVARAVCASRLGSNGKVKFNSRTSYRYMASEIVDRPTFAKVPEKDRCFHCCDMGLAMRNEFRKQQGLTPLVTLFDDI